MSAIDDKLRKDYEEFWSKRRAIQLRQRQELEAELSPERQKLAGSMNTAKNNHNYSANDIANVLGLKNRNFIYLIWNDKPLVELDPAKRRNGRAPRLREDKVKPVEVVKSSELSYEIADLGFGTYHVVVSGEGYSVPYLIDRNEHGEIVTIPEDWYRPSLPPEEREFYRDLIKAVENA